MIAKLTGLLDSLEADHAILDVAGVGYLVFCSARTLNRLGAPGARVSVLVETHVREDRIQLYGFADAAERTWFRVLITVQGVGARVAQALLSVLTPDELLRAIAAQDRAALTRADGVGPKLAARILSELKERVGSLTLGPGAGPSATNSAPVATPSPLATPGETPSAPPGPSGGSGGGNPSAAAEALSALVNLGYGRSEAFAAVLDAGAALGTGATLPALIRLSLQALGRGESSR